MSTELKMTIGLKILFSQHNRTICIFFIKGTESANMKDAGEPTSKEGAIAENTIPDGTKLDSHKQAQIKIGNLDSVNCALKSVV
jgi:hypothetical protein